MNTGESIIYAEIKNETLNSILYEFSSIFKFNIVKDNVKNTSHIYFLDAYAKFSSENIDNITSYFSIMKADFGFIFIDSYGATQFYSNTNNNTIVNMIKNANINIDTSNNEVNNDNYINFYSITIPEQFENLTFQPSVNSTELLNNYKTLDIDTLNNNKLEHILLFSDTEHFIKNIKKLTSEDIYLNTDKSAFYFIEYNQELLNRFKEFMSIIANERKDLLKSQEFFNLLPYLKKIDPEYFTSVECSILNEIISNNSLLTKRKL